MISRKKLDESVKIVFDSNVWEKVTHLDAEPYSIIRHKIETQNITPYICEIAISLESIQKKHRAGFFESYQPATKIVNCDSDGTSITANICFGPNNEAHPPLPEILINRLEAAKRMGFKVIHMNRFGTVRTNEIPTEMFLQPESVEEFWKSSERFTEFEEFIKSIEAGQHEYNQLTQEFGIQSASIPGLARKIPASQHKRFAKAIAEWADGDSLAACYQEGLNYFCTDDKAKNAGKSSIFSLENIAKLSGKFGIKILSSKNVSVL